ncbi:DUF4386 domain-containing protein [Demequina sp. NBRC 110052]|uniref:DUF4386 domain-containing protein n=1 Tax=Demequina sp. NBRC 110052 TaxID=1570341 RepID=UPI0009FC18D9|nr:DUF4386 domain-containing protein [Demequina sp. NBRC 110052]
MSITTAHAPDAVATTAHGPTRRTARVTGVWYLGLAVTGMLGFLVLRPAFHAEDWDSTVDNLAHFPSRTLVFVALELAIVLTQALASVYFYKLLRPLNAAAAWAVAVFGMVNAVAIMGSAATLSVAASVASDATLAPGGDVAATVGLLWTIADAWWAVGAVFFGLWLIPMGHVARSSGRFPVALGWVLLVGGVGYVASAFLGAVPGVVPSGIVGAVSMPATVGELWMIGYLLSIGIRPRTPDAGVAR